MRLNFEYNLECHDEQLVQRLDPLVDERIQQAQHRLTADELAGQPLLGRLRDRLIWLLSPYL